MFTAEPSFFSVFLQKLILKDIALNLKAMTAIKVHCLCIVTGYQKLCPFHSHLPSLSLCLLKQPGTDALILKFRQNCKISNVKFFSHGVCQWISPQKSHQHLSLKCPQQTGLPCLQISMECLQLFRIEIPGNLP